ncbi:imidazolonepropionase-like domain-containing protein [Streptomyces sp. URMC 125]|uniref:imidazolonepropionase-like domain-containing protein n=1 Tax=Streptomyces sp. URMC 125 TaxID=3423419 RepID=UPI003F1A6603
MPTLHAPLAVRLTEDGEPLPGHAVAVEGNHVTAIGLLDELEAAHPGARIRRWPGTLGPGRCAADAAAWLEAAYHPDPREAGALGTEPLTGAALAALDMDETRWGASARRGLQRLLSEGATSLVGPFTRPAVRTAVRRSGLTVLPSPRPSVLSPGGRADFAVHDADGLCLATALAGRLLHRRA